MAELEIAAARLGRDVAIECMARLDQTCFVAKEHAIEQYFKEHRRAAGRVMAEFVAVINRAAHMHPELKPTDEEWRRVVRERRPKPEERPELPPKEQVRHDLDVVGCRIEDLRRIAPRLEDEPASTDAAMVALRTLVSAWEAKPE